MLRWRVILFMVAALAGAVVLVSSAVLAARQGSWGPLESVAWIPAVLVAVWSARTTWCVRPRRQPR